MPPFGPRDYIYRQEVYPFEWVAHELTGRRAPSNKPSGIIETHYIIAGRDYETREEAIEALKRASFNDTESVEFLDAVEVQELGPRRLTLEQTMAWERDLERKQQKQQELPHVEHESHRPGPS